MRLLTDIKDLLSTLNFIDLVFFFAVVTLMILVVTLIYFIKINDDVLKKDLVKGETREMQIVNEITKNLEKSNDDNNMHIDFTDYEKDQEEKAIISYEELLNKNNNYELNYSNEEMQDDLLIKKFDLENLVNHNTEAKNNKVDVRVISYAKEEAFLEALKQLQKELL